MNSNTDSIIKAKISEYFEPDCGESTVTINMVESLSTNLGLQKSKFTELMKRIYVMSKTEVGHNVFKNVKMIKPIPVPSLQSFMKNETNPPPSSPNRRRSPIRGDRSNVSGSKTSSLYAKMGEELKNEKLKSNRLETDLRKKTEECNIHLMFLSKLEKDATINNDLQSEINNLNDNFNKVNEELKLSKELIKKKDEKIKSKEDELNQVKEELSAMERDWEKSIAELRLNKDNVNDMEEELEEATEIFETLNECNESANKKIIQDLTIEVEEKADEILELKEKLITEKRKNVRGPDR